MYNVCISFWCQKVSQIYTKAKNMKKKYIYICIYIYIFLLYVITRYWVEFPGLYRRFLLAVYFICSDVYLLIYPLSSAFLWLRGFVEGILENRKKWIGTWWQSLELWQCALTWTCLEHSSPCCTFQVVSVFLVVMPIRHLWCNCDLKKISQLQFSSFATRKIVLAQLPSHFLQSVF